MGPQGLSGGQVVSSREVGVSGFGVWSCARSVHRVRDTAKPDSPKQLPGDQQRVLWVTKNPKRSLKRIVSLQAEVSGGPGERSCHRGQAAVKWYHSEIESSLFR